MKSSWLPTAEPTVDSCKALEAICPASAAARRLLRIVVDPTPGGDGGGSPGAGADSCAGASDEAACAEGAPPSAAVAALPDATAGIPPAASDGRGATRMHDAHGVRVRA